MRHILNNRLSFSGGGIDDTDGAELDVCRICDVAPTRSFNSVRSLFDDRTLYKKSMYLKLKCKQNYSSLLFQ